MHSHSILVHYLCKVAHRINGRLQTVT